MSFVEIGKYIFCLTHCGQVTQYGDGSMLYKKPIFFTMKEFPQIKDSVILFKVDIIIY